MTTASSVAQTCSLGLSKNQCAYICPHAAIRPFVLTDEELAGFELDTLEMKAPAAMKGMHFIIEPSVLDCLGCGRSRTCSLGSSKNCADICPGNPKLGKALSMVPFSPDAEDMKQEAKNWEYLVKEVKTKQNLVDIRSNVKNSQFAQPLFEFSGACSGCGETPYVKLISQLFGDRQMIANATGCSSIYSASIPSTPYTKNEKGQGLVFNRSALPLRSSKNSLFEDFCELGLGMALGNQKTMVSTNRLKERVAKLLTEATQHENCPAEYKALAEEWIANKEDADKTKEIAPKLREYIKGGAEAGCELCKELQTLDHYLVKRSQWIIGGDGASYDIGYGGLDHVIASGEDVNILVLDTEVYSNTGGQASKATPLGAIAQFFASKASLWAERAAQGKRIRKKDLGMIATTYGYVYVAQIAMGADHAQTLKAIREAEAWHGPSIVIAYAPCIRSTSGRFACKEPRSGRGRQEPVLARLQGTQLGKLPRLDFVFVRRDSA